MKLEAGKYYKTRLGQKAYVAGLTPDEMCFNERCRVLGCIRDKNGYWFTKSWSLGGSCDPSYNNGHDLVSEWTEPVKCGPDIVYLLKYECKCSRNCSMSGHEFFASKEMADYFIRQKEDQYESVEYTLQAYRRSND